ncbi:hypothetical protein [Okeania sp. KiyG1]|nr:hypothetical protein [Okeania sp. KiyG1]
MVIIVRRKKEEGRGKKEEGRRKKEEGRKSHIMFGRVSYNKI